MLESLTQDFVTVCMCVCVIGVRHAITYGNWWEFGVDSGNFRVTVGDQVEGSESSVAVVSSAPTTTHTKTRIRTSRL